MIGKLLENYTYPLLQSIPQNHMKGEIHINKTHSKAAVINCLNWVYVIGDEIDTEFDQKILSILAGKNKDSYIWFGMTKYWEDLTANILKDAMQSFPRFEWEFHADQFARLKSSSEQYEVKQADSHNIDWICDGIQNSIVSFWTTKENFLKHGFGYYIEHDGKIIGLISSAGIFNNKAEIDIMIDKAYQGQGLGKLLSGKFIKSCLEKNILPKWDCAKNNEGSIKLAKSLGFTIVKEYPCNIIKV